MPMARAGACSFEGSETGGSVEGTSGVLVHRFARLKILAERLPRMDARQIAGARATVIAGAIAFGSAAVHG